MVGLNRTLIIQRRESECVCGKRERKRDQGEERMLRTTKIMEQKTKFFCQEVDSTIFFFRHQDTDKKKSLKFCGIWIL